MECPVAQPGGVEVLVVELVRGLASQFEVVLVSDDDAESLQAAGLAPLLAGHFRWQFDKGGAADARALAAKLHQAGVQLAHFHFGGTWYWGCRVAARCPVIYLPAHRIPVVITNHLVHPALEGYCGSHRPLVVKLALFPAVWFSRLRVLRAARAEFAVSMADRDVDRRVFWPFRGRISHMYHSKLDEQQAGPLSAAASRAPVVLALGTIGPRKGQHILVDAFERVARELPDWKLRIVGRTGNQPYYESIRRSAAAGRLGARLEFAGAVADEAVPAEFDRAAIFAMPSLSEGLGLSLQEALFRGCACIGSRVGGIPELIAHDRSGLLVPPGDAAALAVGLRTLMRDAPLRQRLGAQGRELVLEKGMTKQRMVQCHAELYRRVLGELPGGSA